ncbi:hypothetical protein LOTGIDRAFT_130622 [Lottia gigantea]|uniref:Temptin Cys/Cys disulfide domain-containing protein n=1 Tax=Lottia gigantea TaxID=225164 RepID=V3Z3T3_LOTGI|nr:hypothetical protein LOTGIDRAFT_130622 [Lottia gigantea]ESO85313.1 hypothetical protein LOTGIDRAFT_130622 [Lottia gigantea]
MKVLLLLVSLIPLVLSHKSFMQKIPNGMTVPHPCQPGAVWRAVGHTNMHGGHIINSFGLAFHRAGSEWTKELCQADSDQDGKTNGEELGDPECKWAPDADPPTTDAKSHPGKCDVLT